MLAQTPAALVRRWVYGRAQSGGSIRIIARGTWPCRRAADCSVSLAPSCQITPHWDCLLTRGRAMALAGGMVGRQLPSGALRTGKRADWQAGIMLVPHAGAHQLPVVLLLAPEPSPTLPPTKPRRPAVARSLNGWSSSARRAATDGRTGRLAGGGHHLPWGCAKRAAVLPRVC